MKRVGLAVVGIKNFAATHIRNICKVEKEGVIHLTGVVVVDQLNNVEKVKELRRQGVKIFESYDDLLVNGREYVDVITLPTSIYSHADLAIKGMKHGYNILLEKPPTPTIQQLDELIRVEKETGRFCSIGFQFIHSRSIRLLKENILSGKIGKITEIACKGYWPRYKSYYDRNPWAGNTIWNGKIVLDGPMHNAFAHFLNNMLYLAGESMDDSAEPVKVRSELYRAHTYIKCDDTSCLEIETKQGQKLYFYVTHVPVQNYGPYMEIIGTKGKAYWSFNEKTVIELKDGSKIEFDNQGVDPWLEVMRTAARCQLGEIERPYSTPENSRGFVVAINAAYDSAEKIRIIPDRYVKEFMTDEGEYKTVLENIENIMDKAFEERKLLSDIGVEWAKKTKEVDTTNYKEFHPYIERGNF